MAYKLVIKPEVYTDIQSGIDWYNSKQEGLGRRFFEAIEKEYAVLKKAPVFQVRYDDVHCLPVKKFPYMIHFIVEEDAKVVVVLGVINTYLNPNKWKERK